MSDNEQWGVLVSEGKINATGMGSNWWAETSIRMASSGVLITIDSVAIIGGTEFMRCDSREDAEFAAEYIGQHTHPSVAKATTLAAARKAVRAAHARRYDHERGCQYCRAETAPSAT